MVNASNSCAPVAGAAVDIWHSDADGHYSEYAQGGYNGTGQTFLRGIQVTNASDQATFTTIFPGWYSGRATHIHMATVSGDPASGLAAAFTVGVSV